MAGFTEKQQAFIEAYAGNGSEAAIAAGYAPKSARVTAAQLLANPSIAAAIKARQEKRLKPLIATREDRQAMWTAVMRDESVAMKDRLKASELLGRSECDFTEKVEVAGSIDIGVLFDPEKRRQILSRISEDGSDGAQRD